MYIYIYTYNQSGFTSSVRPSGLFDTRRYYNQLEAPNCSFTLETVDASEIPFPFPPGMELLKPGKYWEKKTTFPSTGE